MGSVFTYLGRIFSLTRHVKGSSILLKAPFTILHLSFLCFCEPTALLTCSSHAKSAVWAVDLYAVECVHACSSAWLCSQKAHLCQWHRNNSKKWLPGCGRCGMWQKAVATWQSGSASVCDEPDQKVTDFKAWKPPKNRAPHLWQLHNVCAMCVYLSVCAFVSYEKGKLWIVGFNESLPTGMVTLCWWVNSETLW